MKNVKRNSVKGKKLRTLKMNENEKKSMDFCVVIGIKPEKASGCQQIEKQKRRIARMILIWQVI
jgi:hypothetical protein